MTGGQHRAQPGPVGRLLERWTDRLTRLDVDPIEPRPVALDHIHGFDRDGDGDGGCRDTRCGHHPANQPGSERVVPVPDGQPDWIEARS